MDRDLSEGLIIGATIGLLVVAIRMLFAGASAWQALALVVAGVILCAGQVVLWVRRARRDARPSALRTAAARPRRLSRQNPFAQELTRNWTGLDDRFTKGKQEPEATHDEPIDGKQ
jgi:hypothetical protein